MPRVFLVKQKTDEQPVRRCKNCGKDISNKRKGRNFVVRFVICPIQEKEYSKVGIIIKEKK